MRYFGPLKVANLSGQILFRSPWHSCTFDPDYYSLCSIRNYCNEEGRYAAASMSYAKSALEMQQLAFLAGCFHEAADYFEDRIRRNHEITHS